MTIYDSAQGRRSAILIKLREDSSVTVAQLSRLFGVSEVTIRKDLDNLEERGIIRREHGWAVLHNGDDLSARLAYHYQEKELIARRAAELVQELESYYNSTEWKQDYTADEEGLLPKDLKRGVLSEDGIYNVLELYRERVEEFVSENECNGVSESNHFTEE